MEVLEYLASINANMDALSNNGSSPFYMACLNGRLEGLKFLVLLIDGFLFNGVYFEIFHVMRRSKVYVCAYVCFKMGFL